MKNESFVRKVMFNIIKEAMLAGCLNKEDHMQDLVVSGLQFVAERNGTEKAMETFLNKQLPKEAEAIRAQYVVM